MRFKHILILFLLAATGGIASLHAGYSAFRGTLPGMGDVPAPMQEDTIVTRYPVSKTIPEEYDDLLRQSPADLKDPANVTTQIEYDINSGTYIVRTRVGEMELGTPMSLTPEEYQNYSMQESLRSYFRQKNEEEFQKEINKEFSITDMQFNIGPADRIFGPGGVRVKTQGSAELTIGMKTNKTDNPSLPERSRTQTFFNFDESVQLNVQATVGTKVNFNMNYNTETSFDFDDKQLKLSYTGDEDEIIKSIEAGNVSMTTSNSLINGGAALFGMKTELQFGKLRVNALFAQQNSESKTVSSQGGVQTQEFELDIDEYDENRHFFLAQYFRDNYDNAMSKLPLINSSVSINRIEVWVTNTSGNYDDARNIVAFADLGESTHISNPMFTRSSSTELPSNNANTLYQTMVNTYSGARDISSVSQTFNGILEGGRDYEEIESARLLSSSEYTLNEKLGYISLSSKLQSSEVLAVAFEYTSGGQVYQVGEFSTDNSENTTQCLYVKLLKGTNMSPSMPFWDLMMKNVYALGAYSVQKENFRLNILYQSDTTGTYVNYLSEGNIKDEILLRVMNLDRLDQNNETNPDGFFDFVEGYTILADNGRVIFPVVEPFGSHLREKIGNDIIADKYVFQELYDTTLTYAKQLADKNKFIMRGQYKASSGSEIDLGTTNVTRGSVTVTAGGATLTENVDYTVDYASGRVTILNESILSSGTPVSVSLESQSTYNMQRKTMMGVDLNYQFTPEFNLGATVMHLSEMPLTTKTTFGNEAVNNTLWGLNASYKGESQWLTNMLDKIPLLTLSKPSEISFNAEFAQLIAGHYENEYTGEYSYLDDFESTQSGYDLLSPYSWYLASTPYDDTAGALFPEASLVNNVDYGKNRALLAWYTIDGIFTRQNSRSLPSHITNDDLSNHYVRAVQMEELYPNREQTYNEDNQLSIMNVAYYPKERGPYNLDAVNVNSDGTLTNPQQRWGGMMRALDQVDFETANIEYIEFWLLDPFIYDKLSQGGDLYFNLGEISEDILKDEKKFFENGLPIDGDMSQVDTTVWGKVPIKQSTVYAFDNTSGARSLQDVGLNGLSSEEELTFPTYQNFLEELRPRLSAATIAEMEADPMSVLNNPSGDKFHYFRGSDYDEKQLSILERYKRYNGTEGNSEESTESYSTASKTVPDVEDLNEDNTLNKNEKYYEYKVSIRPEDLKVGSNNIVSIQTSSVRLANGQTETVDWYQFKIPIKQYDRVIGSISDFSSIRFMRMYLTNFTDSVVLRFGSFELVRGDWRTYELSLLEDGAAPVAEATMEVSTVSIEENSDKTPVNYVLPPGVTRVRDSSQPQVRQENEQALSMTITNLGAQDAVAVYKTTSYDLRQYGRLQLFTHAEALSNDVTDLSNGDLWAFIRLGSDYTSNYYEYSVPLSITPEGSYSSDNSNDRETVWPTQNYMDINLETFTDLKLARNRAKQNGQSGVTYQTVYSEYDDETTAKNINMVSIKGNPSLANVKVIMIGVRNKGTEVKSAEVWVNELRLSDFNEEGGWAANANLNLVLSDLGTLNLAGRIETSGFGALDQSVNERRMDDYTQYSISTSLEFGKLFPEKAKVSIPFYYSYSRETTTPKYNPLDQDILLQYALDNAASDAERDSIKNASIDRTIIKSFSFNNVHMDLKSEIPKPWDPANFSLSYSRTIEKSQDPETTYENTLSWQGSFAYSYTPYVKPFRPFEKLKKNNGYTQYLKQLSLNYVPSNISFQSVMSREYYEIQLRDLSTDGSENKIPVSFSQEFYWDRAFSLRWDLTNNLSMQFSSGTNARIEEPYVQVNKKLNPDDYSLWKDSIMQSILDLGTPLAYDQQFNVTWNMPLQQIPALDWINSSASYSATYNWDRGAEIDGEVQIGNTIKNQRQIDWQGAFNIQALYNKNPYLKSINQKYSTSARNSSRNQRQREQEQRRRQRKIEKEITLSPDSNVVLKHDLLTKKVQIRAKGANGKTYKLKYKPINLTDVEISTRDTAHLFLTIYPGPSESEDRFNKVLEYSTRFLMMLRRINIQYTATDGMMLPGFIPEVGDMLGQKQTSLGFAPGIAFAFGAVGEKYIEDADEKGWLIKNSDVNIDPAIINSAKNLNIRTSLEPIPGLKIDLTANWLDSRNTEIQFMYDGWPKTYGGNFSMTTIAIGSAFKGLGSAADNYASDTFDKFLSYRERIAERLESAYANTRYPSSGFMSGHVFANQPYDANNGSVSQNSSDVLIPAFIAAYTGKDPDKIALTPFPSVKSLLPNWSISYTGLMQLPYFKKYFKNLTLSHQYTCTYSIGSYSSYSTWVGTGDGELGFVQNVTTGNPTPSSAYDISSVSITEGFNPLFGVDATMLNNISGKIQYRKSRNLTLNVSSYQIVESQTKSIVLGLGYTYTEFNKVLGTRKTENFSNDLTVNFDFSLNRTQSVIRKIEDAYSQSTSGTLSKSIEISADYGLSRALTVSAFYDIQINNPLVSSTSYPTSNSNYGISLRFSLAQ